MLTRNSSGSLQSGAGVIHVLLREIPVGHWLAEDHEQGPQECEACSSEISLPVSYACKGIKSVLLLETSLLASTLHRCISGWTF